MMMMMMMVVVFGVFGEMKLVRSTKWSDDADEVMKPTVKWLTSDARTLMPARSIKSLIGRLLIIGAIAIMFEE